LLLFARRQGPETTSLTLETLLAQAISLVAAMATKRGVSLEVEGDIRLTIEADATLLQQAVMNLLVNAVQASAHGGRVVIRVSERSAQPPAELGGSRGRYVAVDVADTGSGISAEHLPHLFEPFFTTKAAGEGTGLGLPIASGILRDHGGWLEVTSTSTSGGGTTITMFLPPAQPATPLSTSSQAARLSPPP
jgi:two-component system, NtrC family, sensor kinase